MKARARLTGEFVKALADDFQIYGKRAIEATRLKDPVSYCKIVAQMVPKQVEQTRALDDMSDVEIQDAIDLLRSRLAESAGAGIDPSEKPSKAH